MGQTLGVAEAGGGWAVRGWCCGGLLRLGEAGGASSVECCRHIKLKTAVVWRGRGDGPRLQASTSREERGAARRRGLLFWGGVGFNAHDYSLRDVSPAAGVARSSDNG
ncbi:hypothetical protein E2C01_041152 [Portunus trituberculatus]|uniref:Uncharacterized protein n=1 Tax=Portunus trituberculatus TaxID=210409 RepID=A0A5B7FPX7_PORTR|nr:hypothetical protein [Portunus trituberculatus]